MTRSRTTWWLAPALLVSALVLYEASRQFAHNLSLTAVQAELGFRGRDGYRPTPDVIATTTRRIERLVAARPHHPDYLAAHANDLAWRAYWADDANTARDLLQQAVASQGAAVAWRPARPQDRRQLREYQQLATQVQ